jgi:hypothetical protein
LRINSKAKLPAVTLLAQLLRIIQRMCVEYRICHKTYEFQHWGRSCHAWLERGACEPGEIWNHWQWHKKISAFVPEPEIIDEELKGTWNSKIVRKF